VARAARSTAGRPCGGVDQIADHLVDAGLMIQKLPEQLEVLDGLPQTGLGKPAKAELRERFSGETPEQT
jgi:non-ribosomal peptide synthetase component E (peptide arylation enzyme)